MKKSDESNKVLTLLVGVMARQQVLGNLLVRIGRHVGLPRAQLDLNAQFDEETQRLDAALDQLQTKASEENKE